MLTLGNIWLWNLSVVYFPTICPCPLLHQAGGWEFSPFLIFLELPLLLFLGNVERTGLCSPCFWQPIFPVPVTVPLRVTKLNFVPKHFALVWFCYCCWLISQTRPCHVARTGKPPASVSQELGLQTIPPSLTLALAVSCASSRLWWEAILALESSQGGGVLKHGLTACSTTDSIQ